jgi:hypothetical protein
LNLLIIFLLHGGASCIVEEDAELTAAHFFVQRGEERGDRAGHRGGEAGILAQQGTEEG